MAKPADDPSASDQPYAVLLDVGHGNAAIFRDGDTAVVVDAGSGDLVAGTLESMGIREIAALVISHRHHDHMSELPSLLGSHELCVRQLFLNADPTRDPESRFERDLRGAFNDSYERNKTELAAANETIGGRMGTDRLHVDVLAPDSDMALMGIGAERGNGSVGPHAAAVVMRIEVDGGRAVLLGADLEAREFDRLIERRADAMAADVLVYPHHGGLSGAGNAAAEEAFARRLTGAVDPQVVVFSNGRDSHPNPRREVVRGVRSARQEPRVRVLCTQLAKACSAAQASTGHVDPTVRSAGEISGSSCSGSIRVDLSGADPLLPNGSRHMDFVLHEVGKTAMCLTVGE